MVPSGHVPDLAGTPLVSREAGSGTRDAFSAAMLAGAAAAGLATLMALRTRQQSRQQPPTAKAQTPA
ncbi:hypothetical protein [Streptomyces sp. NPDC058457]|uniref:hypothetical protein n=1 Tax=Streptomyces sp. NPDC058457 TaxID=3346507 RepID=UPI0036548523